MENNYKLSIDFIMIIGKYFKSNSDFINIMKVCKKYKELVLMYKFNPISNIKLFENIETQHFYNKEDIVNKKNGLYRYIYWYLVDYELIKNKKGNEIFKNIELNYKKIGWIRECSEMISFLREKREPPLEIENGNCIIPEGVIKIGNNCFENCSPLTNIKLPYSLKEIGCNAFSHTGITTIIIPEGITKIEFRCFFSCYQLINVTLPYSLKKIREGAFSNTKITTITIPEGVTKIQDFCFENCSELIKIKLPSSLKKIGDYSFMLCEKLNEIILCYNIPKIGYNIPKNFSLKGWKLIKHKNGINKLIK